jgi:uncharacterized glyoxalase superfamily protein PhnB
MKLTAVRIVTPDVATLAHFYEGLTGVAPVGSDEYVELRTGGATLSLSSASAARVCSGGALPVGANRSMILDFEVHDVDAERRRLAGAVARWVLEPTTLPWGNRSSMFRDPDGHLVHLFHREKA